MTQEFFYAIGGLGMFLVGMEILTSALRDAAGSRLRKILARFTTTPLRGVMTGAIGTIIIQSSSATTVLTVGFVGAGLLSMSEALGIIYGANIGTTATGWLVSLIGFKLNLLSVAFSLLLPTSLLSLLGRGAWTRLGRGISGLCLLVIGLHFMQTGLAHLGDTISPQALQARGALGFALFVLVGLVLTVVMQASVAAMALALVMLQGDMISLTQAIALVIGMNIGTTFTAIIASIGGSRPMRQTAVANLIFNCAIAVLALPLLFLSAPALAILAEHQGPMTALLVFHTGFNIVGTAVFLPITQPFARMVARLVPEKKSDQIITLDQKLLDDPDAALISAQAAAEKIARILFGALGSALKDPADYRRIATLSPLNNALSDLEEFLSHIHPDHVGEEEERTYSALLHQTDHMARLLQRAQKTTHIQKLLDNHLIRRPTLAVGAAFRRLATAQDIEGEALRLARLHALVRHRKDKHRRGLLLGEHAGIYSLKDVFTHTDAMRWLDRSLHHAERVMHYQTIARQEFPSAPREAEGI
ncbi:MAG: Na/Pi symporter [Pseudopelagicola sp.]|nr:Na/Pi symporter [Pseudopelagicola sp.]